jgi:hypothetical protein
LRLGKVMDGLERIKWALDPDAPNELFAETEDF